MTTWLTAKQAAEHIGASIEIVRSAVKAGDLPAYPIGSGRREYRLDVDDVDAWMKSRSWEPA